MKIKFNWTLKSYLNNWKQYHNTCVELYDDRIMSFGEKALVWLILLVFLPVVVIGGCPD